MPKSLVLEVLTERLQEHEALQAWTHVHPEAARPCSIEVLKRKRRNAVFRLNGVAADGGAMIAKRTRQVTGEVERLIYHLILPHVPLPSLQCYGFVRQAETELCWLFLEDAGCIPYSVQDARHRTLAGRWLAETHRVDVPAEIRRSLPDRDLGHYLHQLRDCRARLLDHLAGTPLSGEQALVFHRLLAFCDDVEAQWSLIEMICATMPRTLVHGDFVAKNLHIRNDTADDVLLVFDWQYAGWGIAATDLAQFIDKVASPDLDAYLSGMRVSRRSLGAGDVRAVAACGSLLRILDEVHWETKGLRIGESKAVVYAAACLQVYADTVPEAWSTFTRSCT